MKSAKEIVSGMETLVEEIVKTAEQLREMSCIKIVEDELNILQERQEYLIERLLELNVQYEDDSKGKGNSSSIDKIQERLADFERLNQAYIENLQVRRGLIQFELEDNQRTRQVLDEVKGAYGTANKKMTTSRSKIDTTS